MAFSLFSFQRTDLGGPFGPDLGSYRHPTLRSRATFNRQLCRGYRLRFSVSALGEQPLSSDRVRTFVRAADLSESCVSNQDCCRFFYSALEDPRSRAFKEPLRVLQRPPLPTLPLPGTQTIGRRFRLVKLFTRAFCPAPRFVHLAGALRSAPALLSCGPRILAGQLVAVKPCFDLFSRSSLGTLDPRLAAGPLSCGGRILGDQLVAVNVFLRSF